MSRRLRIEISCTINQPAAASPEWPPGTVLNAAGRPRDLWRRWPSCCQRIYYATLLASLAENPHAPARPAICPSHGDVRKRPDAP